MRELTAAGLIHRSLTLLFSILVYPLRSKGEEGHSAAAQIVSG